MEQRSKIILLGQSGVGKTALFGRYALDMDEFSNLPTTRGAGFWLKEVKINGEIKQLSIWDTAGHEVYRSIAKTYFQGVKGAILVYDITNNKTFLELEFWLNELRTHGPKNCIISVVGNKEDLIDRETVDPKVARAWAKKNNAEFFKTSALTGFAVSRVFEDMARKISVDPPILGTSVILRKHQPVKKCC